METPFPVTINDQEEIYAEAKVVATKTAKSARPFCEMVFDQVHQVICAPRSAALRRAPLLFGE